MNFYKHHIGDYDSHTAHLTWLEDAAYSRLMRLYYRSEAPPPADVAKVCRLVRAVSKPERDAVESVLNEFFFLKSDGWHNARCDDEIAKANAQAETNRQIAEQREAKKRARKDHESCDESLHEPSTNRLPDTIGEREPSQTPDTRLQEETPVVPSGDKPDPVPYAEIVEVFNETLTNLPKVRKLDAARKRAIRKIWSEAPEHQSVPDFWRPLFEECADDPFLNGTGPYTNGHENWRPDFDFMIRPKTITKVYERAMQRVEKA